MRFVGSLTVFLLVAFVPVLASEPGQPLDCSDIVFEEPGLVCEQVSNLDTSKGGNMALDNQGRRLTVSLGGGGVQLLAGVVGEVPSTIAIATIPWRDGINGTSDRIRPSDCNGSSSLCSGANAGTLVLGDTLWFDPIEGAVYLPLTAYCVSAIGQIGGEGCDYGYSQAHMRIVGFARLFEIFQTYTPTAGPISFRVPPIPEGLPAADHFDTYYGDLATLGDFGLAQALQCRFPAELPDRGDYLTVADPLPDPEPGTGRYYVTAVNYSGQTRYGRKTMGGVLSGRDPSVLPGCDQ